MTPTKKICPKCGAVADTSDQSHFCTACGTKLEISAEEAHSNETPGGNVATRQSGGGSSIVRVLVGVVIGIGVAALAFHGGFLGGSDSAGLRSAEPSKSASSTASTSASAAASTSASSAASSNPPQTTTSSSSAQNASGTSVATQTTMVQTDEGRPYKNEFFELLLPSTWDGKCEIYRTEETREAMNATNYTYHFKYDKVAQFSIKCTLFNMDGDARIGSSSSGYQIEFHPTEFMDPDDKLFIRSSIKIR